MSNQIIQIFLFSMYIIKNSKKYSSAEKRSNLWTQLKTLN